MSTCKLYLVDSLSENHNSSSTPHVPKSIVIHDKPDEIVTIGREYSKSKVNYVLEDSSKPHVVSRLHATLRYNREDCSFSLTDQSVNGTYVNNVRVPLGGLKLESGDIVCFFHRNGANIKPGDKVEPFDTHLKYRVEFVNKAVDENDDIDDNDEEEEIDDGDNRANDTSEKASAAEDGGAVMLVNTSTSGSSSSEESCLADQLCAIHVRESAVPCDDKDSASPTPEIRDAEGAEPPEQHEREEKGACYSGGLQYAEQRKAENDAAARAAAESSGGGSADNKGGAGVGGPSGSENSEEVICPICCHALEPEHFCGFGKCFDLKCSTPHVFCQDCVETMVDDAVEACQRSKSRIRVKCPWDRKRNREIVLCHERCTIKKFRKAREAFWYVHNRLERATYLDRERYDEIMGPMLAEKKLPRGVCLGCFCDLDLSRPYYGYQKCCAVHPFCYHCVLGHHELLNVSSCPVSGVFEFDYGRLVVVDGLTAYTVAYTDELVAYMWEHRADAEMMWVLLNPQNVVTNSTERANLTLRHLPYER